jgi:putative inorganic carbon (hco3(-)) transporter
MYQSFTQILKNSTFPVWMLSFYTFIWFLQIGNRITFLGDIRIEFLVGVSLILLSLKQWFNRKESPHHFHQGFVKSIFFLYFVFVIYTFASYNRELSWIVFSDRIIKFSMFTLFIGALVRTKAELTLVLLGFLLAMSKIIQEGIFGIVTGGMIWQNQGIPRLHGVTLLYRHPNSLSGAAVGALPFFLFLFQFQTKLIKCAFAAAIIGLLLIIMYTGSRTGYVATLVLFCAVILRMGLFKPRTIAALLTIAIAGMLFVPQDYQDRFGTMFKSGEEKGSSALKRIEILEDAWAIVGKYPMGVGVSAFTTVRENEFGRTQDTHNLYLEVLTNIGPLGFIAFCMFVVALIKTNLNARQIFIKANENYLAEMCFIINLYILCRLVLGLFGMDLYEVYWWFAAGFSIALAKMAAQVVGHEKIA